MLKRAEMLNRRASHPKFKVYEILKTLNLQVGAVVADIGCGGGYFTMRFAGAVGLDGRVYAVDTNKKFLDYVKNQAQQNQMTNVKTVLVDENRRSMEEKSLVIALARKEKSLTTTR